jgi:hypothetical protein
MSIALWTTLIYLGVLVAVLAVGLIMIAVRLWAAARDIERIRLALTGVQEHSDPLGANVETINGALSQLGAGLASVRGRLGRTDAVLGALVAPPAEGSSVA